MEAHANGNSARWVREFYGPQAPTIDNLTGHELPPVDPASFPLTDALEDIETKVDTATRAVVRCPECGRLYVQREHGKNEYDCYKPEAEK